MQLYHECLLKYYSICYNLIKIAIPIPYDKKGGQAKRKSAEFNGLEVLYDRENRFCGEAAGMKAVTSAQMKEIERKADEAGLSYYQMMENAGTGAAEYISSKGSVEGKNVLIFCGKGNNGGDGFVVARKLKERGASVRVILTEGEPKTEDAIKNRQICRSMFIPEMELTEEKGTGLTAWGEELSFIIEHTNLIVDAIYGTGFHGELREPVRTVAGIINRSRAEVYSLDIPSGLNADTGEADRDTVQADCTIVFHRLKPAHTDENCIVHCGQIQCISIGIEEVLNDETIRSLPR